MDQQQQQSPPKPFLKKPAPLIKFINKNDEVAQHHHHHHLHVTHHYAGDGYVDDETPDGNMNYEELEPFVGDDIESSSAASHTINLNQGLNGSIDRMLQNNIDQIIQNPTGGTTRKRRNASNQGQTPHQFAGSSWNEIVPASDLERSSGKVICVILLGCLICCSITFVVLIILITLFVDSETFNDVFNHPFG